MTLCATALLWVTAVPLVSRAEGEDVSGTTIHRLGDVPAPPSLPDLTHPKGALGFETTLASTTANPPSGSSSTPPATVTMIERISFDWNLYNRHWFLGGSEDVAYGDPGNGGSSTAVASYPELWVRGIWATTEGLAFGGGLAMDAPLFLRRPESDAALVAAQARVVRPWDFVVFDDNKVSFRPFVDARIVQGPVMLQLREGFDLQGIVAKAQIPDPSVVSRTEIFVGYRPIDPLVIGLEAWEVYFVSAPTLPNGMTFPDNLRATFSFSPMVRYMGQVLRPCLSAILPFNGTLLNEVHSYWAVRLGLDVALE